MLADLIEQVTRAIQHYKQHGQHPTERETIDKLVHPFMGHVLGVDYHNPAEVTAEYDAAIGRSKGEKVDYAIRQNGDPVILIECKALNTPLDDKAVQLRRYIGALPQVSLGILTDGRRYQFFSDLDAVNILDAEPFFSVDLMELTSEAKERLTLFHADCLDVEAIKEAGRSWKVVAALVKSLEQEWTKPSTGYITHFAKPLYQGVLTESVRKQYAGFLNEAHQVFLRKQVDSIRGSRLETTRADTIEETPQVPCKPPLDGWRPLTALEEGVSDPPQKVRFTDGSIANAGNWNALFRVVTLKLDSEGHFHPDTLPKGLRNLISIVEQGTRKKNRLQLSNGLSILRHWNASNCLRHSKRLLKECGHDPAQVYVT